MSNKYQCVTTIFPIIFLFICQEKIDENLIVKLAKADTNAESNHRYEARMHTGGKIKGDMFSKKLGRGPCCEKLITSLFRYSTYRFDYDNLKF